jgi:UDP-N-acetylmuramoylalanine--D-glutamate ligase
VALDVEAKRVTVAGAARSGIAAATLLAARGARVTVSDRRAWVPEADSLRALGVQVELGNHATETFTSADLVVLSPGVRPDQPAVCEARARGVPVISELELASRWLQGRVIAVTGTKGKSTTTVLTGRMLEAAGYRVAVSGNIGVPLSTQVETSTPETLHVVETSSFQLAQTEQFHPWIAVLLNFSPDHLDWHPSLEAYAAAKARIFANQTVRDWAVLNANDPASLELARGARASRQYFSCRAAVADGVVIENEWIVEKRGASTKRLVPLDAVHVIGSHLVGDVVAAVAAGSLVGATPASMTAAVDTFDGLEHVMEFVADIDGVRFINDSKATNVESALRAIESFESGLVAIIGGRFKGGDLSVLAGPLRGRARAVIAIGEAKSMVAAALSGCVEVREAASLAEAVEVAFRLARPAGVVLLAPACASFDMFRDYADRGERFKAEVARIAQTER